MVKNGFPRGSILGLILFNILINDKLMIIEQSAICNFADDNALYSCGEWLTEVEENLIFDTRGILYWLRLSSLKAKPGKFQFRILGVLSSSGVLSETYIKKEIIKVEASDVLLLGTTVDKKLTSEQDTENLCRKEQYNLHAFWRKVSFSQ